MIDVTGRKTNILKPDILKNLDKEITLTSEQASKTLLNKKYNGTCELVYEGDIREGLILSLSSSGTLVIGLLKNE